MTRIVSVRARSVAIPLQVATAFSNRQVTARHYGLVEVTGDDGIVGIGFCYVGSGGGSAFPVVVQSLLAPLLVGRECHAVERLWQDMYQEALLQGRAGIVMRAISALDTALWDHNARAARLPLYKFLGAWLSERVPAYASGGYYLPGKTPDMLGEEVAGYVATGWRAVKIKVGRFGPDVEEARVSAARQAIGPDVLLMLDCNNAWSDLPTALQYVRRFEKYEPYFIEEPFGPDDIANHARLARATPITVATGEIEVGRWRFKELMDAGAAGLLQADACVCGGITEFRRIAATAASYGIPVSPHWFHDLHIHLVAAIPNGQHVEFFPDDQVLNFRVLLDRQIEHSEGSLLLPGEPGLGFGFLAERVEQYATAAWTQSRA